MTLLRALRAGAQNDNSCTLVSAGEQDDAVAVVIVEERKALHHPRIEAAARVPRDLADHV
jgi:hypothetical protein